MSIWILLEATFPALVDGVATEMAAYLHSDWDHVDSSYHRPDSFLAHFSVRLALVDSAGQPSTTARIVMKVVTLMRETKEVNLLPAA